MRTKITTLIMIVVASGIFVMSSCAPPPAPKNGSVTFWNTTCPNVVTVSISGQANQDITTSVNPTSCGVTGAATFSLAPGSYNYTATTTGCSTNSYSGSATITAEGCSILQLQ